MKLCAISLIAMLVVATEANAMETTEKPTTITQNQMVAMRFKTINSLIPSIEKALAGNPKLMDQHSAIIEEASKLIFCTAYKLKSALENPTSAVQGQEKR